MVSRLLWQQANPAMALIDHNHIRRVNSVSRALQDLILRVQRSNLACGISGAVDAKLHNARQALHAAHNRERREVRRKLAAFVRAVEAQRGRELPPGDADLLLERARTIPLFL